MDLSKCTHLKDGREILYGPVRTGYLDGHPWECVVMNTSGSLVTFSYTDEGKWNSSRDNPKLDLALPEPEWVYVKYVDSAGMICAGDVEMRAKFLRTARQSATHRYPSGRPGELEKIPEKDNVE